MTKLSVLTACTCMVAMHAMKLDDSACEDGLHPLNSRARLLYYSIMSIEMLYIELVYE